MVSKDLITLGLSSGSQPQAHIDSNPICRLARVGLVHGNASEPARYPEPSGTDADRQCGIARDARVWRTWNFAALDRGHTSRDIMGSLIKRVSSSVGPFWCPPKNSNTERQGE